MHIRGVAALKAVRRRAGRVLAKPGPRVHDVLSPPRVRAGMAIAIITPVVLAGSVGASAQSTRTQVRDAAVTPLAAVEPSPQNHTGPSVVAVTKAPTPFHIASTSASSPPPAAVVNSPGALGIPAMALSAYRNAERMMAAAQPTCGVSWNLLAGIGRIESMHANGGATDASGTAVRPIYGPTLDGTLPGNEVIVQSRVADRVTYARAMGPMQFLPGTWSRYASDGDGDGKAEVQNLFDSTLAAARYLCSGGMNLRDQSHVMAAILRYNNSVAYARNVLGWAAAYATGVVPMDLPPITGSVPALGDKHLEHLENYEGLGPGLPINALALPEGDPMALMSLLQRDGVANQISGVPGFAPGQRLGPLPGPVPQLAPTPQAPAPPPWVPPWMQQKPEPECAVFCIEDNVPPPPLQPALGAPAQAQPMLPPGPPLLGPPPPPGPPAPIGPLPPAPGPPPGPAPGPVGAPAGPAPGPVA
ncbi:lytic transglycosylase domain-containing protein [Mycolicibacterium holsaticum]|uniref:lytic transglycosylase domain-containing protein n=1 Tax=Mycolicibacterium holsaticum TaxID=152142 RepID=UPI001E3DA44F|nr:lytic murein transglycosylase [Mycolicibacterium holsaticum]